MAKIIIFSGAGISAESGISTFRDADGFWENFKIENICSADSMQCNRKETINFYDNRRLEIKNKKPNKAHIKLKEIQDKYPNDIKIITQNVDDLFEKAECNNVLHLHGFLTQIYCEKCEFKEDIGYKKQNDAYKFCPKCKTDALRPNIIFFGEAAPKYKNMFKEFDTCEMLVVIGTSGNVINTDMFLYPGIKYSILNNLQESSAINENLYSKVLYKKATEAIDEIVQEIEEMI